MPRHISNSGPTHGTGGPLGGDTPPHAHIHPPHSGARRDGISHGKFRRPVLVAALLSWSLSHLQGLFTVITKCDGQWERANSRPRIESHMTGGCNKHNNTPRTQYQSFLPDQPQPSRNPPTKRPGLLPPKGTNTKMAFAHRKVAAGLAKGWSKMIDRCIDLISRSWSRSFLLCNATMSVPTFYNKEAERAGLVGSD